MSDEYQNNGFGGNNNGYSDNNGFGGNNNGYSDNSGFGGNNNGYSGNNGFGGNNNGYSNNNGFGGNNNGYSNNNGFGGNNNGYSDNNGFGGNNNGYSSNNGFGSNNNGYGSNNGFGGNPNGFGAGSSFNNNDSDYDPNAPLYHPENDTPYDPNAPLYHPTSESTYSMPHTVTIPKKKFNIVPLCIFLAVLIGVGVFVYIKFFNKTSIKDFLESPQGKVELANVEKQARGDAFSEFDTKVYANDQDQLIFEYKYKEYLYFEPGEKEVAQEEASRLMESYKKSAAKEIEKMMNGYHLKEFSIVFLYLNADSSELYRYEVFLSDKG